LPKQEEPFSGLSGTLPEVRAWTSCTDQEPGTTYRGLQLTILPGRELPLVERQDHADGNLFENSLNVKFSGGASGFVLRYTTGFAEPLNTSASISGEATMTLTQSTRLALRWFTADGQPASGVKRVAFGRIDDNPPHAPEDFTVRACYCQSSDGRLEIEDYHGPNPVVRIPATLDGKAVYNLCSSGLWNLNCLAVIMPPGLAHCGYHFDSCAELELLEFPQGLRRLTDGTARNCSQLRKVFLPDSLLEIGQEAFAGCILLDDLTLPNQLLTIEANAFRDCHVLNSVVFPANLRQIGHHAFWNCQALTEVTFVGAPPSRMNDQPIFEGSTITKINALADMGWEDFFEGIPVNLMDAIIPVISGLTNNNSDFFEDQLTVAVSIPGTRELHQLSAIPWMAAPRPRNHSCSKPPLNFNRIASSLQEPFCRISQPARRSHVPSSKPIPINSENASSMMKRQIAGSTAEEKPSSHCPPPANFSPAWPAIRNAAAL